MKRQIQHVRYEHPEMGSLTVERLQSELVNYQVARQVRHLIGVAYGDEFESLRTPVNDRLPRGRISKAYLTDESAAIEAQQERIEKSLASGSTYWVLCAPNQPGQKGQNPALDGLVKTSPSRATLLQRLHIASPNCYVDDIMVRPGADAGPTFRGVGSMLLHTALKYDQYKPSATVVADTFRMGRAGPEFFSSVGFERQPDSIPPATVFNRGQENEIHLPMDRREAQLDEVVQRLTARFDWLQAAEVTYTA